jgi:hypothetical protein
VSIYACFSVFIHVYDTIFIETGENIDELIFDLHLKSFTQSIYLIKQWVFYQNQLKFICIRNIMIEF